MAQTRDQEGHDHGQLGAGKTARGEEDVALEEVVHGDVPFAAELEPVLAVPPVGIEVAVGEAGELGEGAEGILPDDEESEEEFDHEGEEHEGDGLGEDEGFVRHVICLFEADGGVGEDGGDEFFGDDGHEEDAAKDGEGFPEDLAPADAWGAWVFEFVAEGRAENVVGEVVEGEVLGEGDVSHRGGEFCCEVFAEFFEGFTLLLCFFFGLLGFRGVVGADLTQAGGRSWVDDCLIHRGASFWGIEVVEAALGLGEVAVVEGVAVHFHEEGESVEGEEDLSSPCPFEQEGPFDPDEQPYHLVETLYPFTGVTPLQEAIATSEEFLKGQACKYAEHHQAVSNSQRSNVS